MKIALAQTNPVVGDLKGNHRKIEENIRRAETEGANLVLFPELAITGYPPKDLLDRERFVDAQRRAIQEIAKMVKRTAAVVGFVDRDKSGRQPALLNAAAVMREGKIVSVHHKSLLPTYDVFDEVRYFSTAERVAPASLTLPSPGGRGNEAASGRGDETTIGVTICEDAWNDESFWSTRRYRSNPIAELTRAGARIIVNSSASPYVFGKRDLRRRMFSDLAKRHDCFFLTVNQAGGNDELIFDGNSAAFAPDGSQIAQLAGFETDFAVIDLDKAKAVAVRDEDIGAMHDALVLGTRDYIRKSGFKGATVGLSGGIDSAVTVCIAVAALGAENVRALSLPGPYSSQHSIDDAKTLARNLGIRLDDVRIDNTFAAYLEALGPIFAGTQPDIAEENLQSRIRGALLMALSNKFGHLVLATGNKSELSVGYCTLYGDMCGSLAVIGDVPKTMVYELARYINREREIIPQSSVTKPPSAELKPDQTDQDTLPPYETLDEILRLVVEEHKEADEVIAMGFDEETVRRVVRMIWRSEYKRKQAAPVLKVTSKAFGIGRRMPIVQGWM